MQVTLINMPLPEELPKHGRRVFCSMLRKQVVKVTGGEGGKTSFWVTFFYWARFDDQILIPSCVVHEGGELCELFAKYLPSDWLVHAAPSCYMGKDGWFKIAVHFKLYGGPKRPIYMLFVMATTLTWILMHGNYGLMIKYFPTLVERMALMRTR